MKGVYNGRLTVMSHGLVVITEHELTLYNNEYMASVKWGYSDISLVYKYKEKEKNQAALSYIQFLLGLWLHA